MSIEVEGVKYKVVESLGFSHDRGQYAKVVATPDGERVVVKNPGRGEPWKFSKPVIRFGMLGSVQGQSGS